ncbi:MAG: hypothetical protein AAF468_03550 [Pseudomonadota bacterium]
MIRSLDLILVAAMICGAVWTFSIKHQAEQSAEEVARLQKLIQAEKEKINLLRADWALLNQPARLQKLAETHAEELQLKPLKSTQIAKEGELPAIRPPEDPENDPIGDLVETKSEKDPLTTGSTRVADE